MKVVFLTFANNQFQRLHYLSREEDNISNALRRRALHSHFFIEKQSIAEKKHIANAIYHHWQNIAVFHFSGHANLEELEFADGTGKLVGLSELLKLQNNIKLIFLNGCSTYGHIEAYQKCGVPAIIATSAPVEDEIAADFSSFFYEAFSLEGVTIGEAFQLAKGKIALLYDFYDLDFFPSERSSEGEGTRGPDIPGKKKDTFNWGLYYVDKKALDWSLPYQPLTVTAPIDRINLTSHLIDVFKAYCRDIRRLIEAEEEGEIINPGEYRAAIINCLPSPLGVLLRKLLVQIPEGIADIKKENLEQVVAVYNVLMEIVAFTMINQIWEAQQIKPLQIRDKFKNKIRSFFKLSEEERKTYNYVELIRCIRLVFDDNQVNYFIDELNGLKEILLKDQEFSRGHTFMESMKWLLIKNRIDANALPNNYLLAENYLADFLSKLGFCAKYRMTAVKNINLVQPRHMPRPIYSHSLVQLIACGTYDADLLPYNAYTYSRSVIILKSLKNVEEFLTLTPFVIDKNAYDEKSRKSSIFFFSHYEPSSKSYIFIRPDKANEKLEIKKTTATDIRGRRRLNPVQQYHNEIVEQFDAFAGLLFNNTFGQL